MAKPEASGVPFDESLRFVAASVRSRSETFERPVLMVSSASPGEGKTTVSVGLGRALADAGLHALVIDLNFRSPGVVAPTGRTDGGGAAKALGGQGPLEHEIQRVETANGCLSLLTAGQPAGDPALLLAEDRINALVTAALRVADFVVIDTPAVIPFPESLSIGAAAGTALLVAEARRRSLPRLERARDLLERNRVKIVGLVLNSHF